MDIEEHMKQILDIPVQQFQQNDWIDVRLNEPSSSVDFWKRS